MLMSGKQQAPPACTCLRLPTRHLQSTDVPHASKQIMQESVSWCVSCRAASLGTAPEACRHLQDSRKLWTLMLLRTVHVCEAVCICLHLPLASMAHRDWDKEMGQQDVRWTQRIQENVGSDTWIWMSMHNSLEQCCSLENFEGGKDYTNRGM